MAAMSLQRTLLVIVLAAALASVPVASMAVSPPYLTTAFIAIHAVQATELGVKGVSVNLNNTMSTAQYAVIFIDLTNTSGQTLFVQSVAGSFAAGQNKTLFFGTTTLSPGTYKVEVFVTTGDFVPLSAASAVQITV
jgi:hypothetical protein